MDPNWLVVTMHFAGPIRSSAIASRFFDLFASTYDQKFEKMGEAEPLRRKFDLSQAILEWERNRGSMNYERGSYIFQGRLPREFYALPHWYGKGNPGWTDTISVRFALDMQSEQELANASQKALEVLKGLAQLNVPLYGKAYTSPEWNAKEFKEYSLPRGGSARETIALTPNHGIVDLYWANYFGPPYVRIFGEESIRRVECPLKENSENGVLLAFSNNATMWSDARVRELQEKAKTVLNHGAFYERLSDRKPSLDLKKTKM